jgi:hypothetical protein
MSEQQAYTFKWKHGPAPGLTFYSGHETAHGEDAEQAERRALRMVCQRGGFSPGCITMQLVPPGAISNTGAKP